MPQEMEFSRSLEKALSHPETFMDSIVPLVKEFTDSKLENLLAVYESGNVVSARLVSSLFKDHGGDKVFDSLLKKLDVHKPKQFPEIAEIFGECNYAPAAEKLAEAVDEKFPELVLPAIKALAALKRNKLADKLLADFFLSFEDEVKLSGSLKYLLPRHETFVPIFLSKYRGLSSERKLWVLKYLAETGHPETLKLFSEELEAEPLERGIYCISGLGQLCSDEAVERLAKHTKEPDWFLRKRIAEALGRTGQASAIDPLLTMLKDDSVLVRAAAVESISKVGNKDPDALIKKLEKSSPVEKINLIRAMGQLKNSKFIEPLVKALQDRNTLFFTVDALGDLGFAEAQAPLKRLLKDDLWFNRLNALEALSKLPIDNLFALAREALKDENDMVRNAASRIIASQNKKSKNSI